MVAALTAAMLVAVLLQVVFGALGPALVEDLGLTRGQLGSLTAAMYVSGSLLSPLAGRLVDRVGGGGPMLALFALKAVGIAVVAAAPGYPALLVGAVVGGTAVALCNPVTNLVIQVHVPGARQGVVTGVKQSGIQLGVFAGSAALPALAATAGWRAAVWALVGVCAAGAVLARAAVPPTRPPPGHHRVVRGPLPPGTGWLTGYATAMGIGIAAIGAYLPLYGVERLGMSAVAAGWLTAVVGGVGVIARIALGRAADRSTTPPQVVLVRLAVVALLAAVAVLAAPSGLRDLVWVGAVLAGAGAAAWNSVGMLAIIRGADRAVAGRAVGVVLLGFYGGFVIGPLAFGSVVDATDGYGLAWTGVLIAFGAALATAVAWVSRPPRPTPAPAT